MNRSVETETMLLSARKSKGRRECDEKTVGNCEYGEQDLVDKLTTIQIGVASVRACMRVGLRLQRGTEKT